MIALLTLFLSLLLSPRPALAQTPPFTGTFVTFTDATLNIPESKLVAFFDDLSALKMDTIILTPLQIEKKSADGCKKPVYSWSRDLLDSNNPDPTNPTLLDRYFRHAESRNIKIFVSLPKTGSECPDYIQDSKVATRISRFLSNSEDPQNTLNFVLSKYGSSPSFAGWYIPNEPHFTYNEKVNPTEIAYFRTLVVAIRSKSDKPILIAPSFVGVKNRTPKMFADKAKEFYDGIRAPNNYTGIIFTWQDSVAEVGTNNFWRETVAGGADSYNIEYYKALSQALGGSDILWSDNEMGNCCVSPSYAWGTGILKPNTVARLEQQAQNSPLGVVGKRVVWIQQTQLATTDSSLNRAFGADRLFHTYRAYYGLGSGEFIRPVSYKWLTPPSPSYPDTNNSELFDGLTGVPGTGGDKRISPPTDPRWTGVQGDTTLTFDLGQAKNVDYLAIHLLRFEPLGVNYPTRYDFFCSQNGTNWDTLGSYNFPITNNVDGEFVMSNPGTSPFHRTCRYLKLSMTNTKWTFATEVEISSVSRSPVYQTVSVPPTSATSPTPSCSRFSQGDSNCDGQVDLVDFSAWKMIFITNQASTRTDFNHDGSTNLTDFAVWKSAFIYQNH